MQRSTRRFFAPLAAITLVALGARGDGATLGELWPTHEFEFARMVYNDGGTCIWGYDPCWTVDYPEAEYFFHKGVSRLSRVDMGSNGVVVDLHRDSLFDYPFLYSVEVGFWRLSESDAERLREYLLRGGFLMVDDFHGSEQWISFTQSMNRVFPDRPIQNIADTSEILHVVYSLDERIQIPGLAALQNGVTYERDGYDPHWRGIYDDDGRLMVAINHNMDLGDSWEHADDPTYPQEMTNLGIRFAVNYVIYAMTH
jgi:hypothetical protein